MNKSLLAGLGLLCLNLATTAQDFERALSPRPLHFPRDHGSHPTFRTEWWYLTGWLARPGEKEPAWGYQLTFFRSAFGRPGAAPPQRRSPLVVRDLVIYHGALSDLESGRAYHAQHLSRQAAGWAWAAEDSLNVGLFGHRLMQTSDTAWSAHFAVEGHKVELELGISAEPLAHGRDPGLSLKGPHPGQASYYYSMPRIETRAHISGPTGHPSRVLHGQSWFDHEFGSQQLAAGVAGWDWFSVGLDDGSHLMVYLLRREDGSFTPSSSGTLSLPDGTRYHLGAADFALQAQDHWLSPHSGATYPSGWKLRLPAYDLELRVEPMIEDQEVDGTQTTGIIYWEGLCSFAGKRGQRPVSGYGYVELVGYAAPLDGRF